MEQQKSENVGEDKLLTVKEAAEYLRLNPNTLATYRCTGKGPAYLKWGARRILYRLSELNRYLQEVVPNGCGVSRPDVRARREADGEGGAR